MPLGLAAALWAGRFVKSVLYGLSANDPITIAVAVALVAVVSALAGFLPALRASNVDPMEALRQQEATLAVSSALSGDALALVESELGRIRYVFR